MKYAFIDKHRSEYPVKSLCRELDVSRSLYYAQKKAKPSLQSQEDLALHAHIVRLNAAHRWAPMVIKMWRLFHAEGIQCGKHCVRRLTAMRIRQGRLHLAIVIDLYASRVVGRSIDTTQATTYNWQH